MNIRLPRRRLLTRLLAGAAGTTGAFGPIMPAGAEPAWPTRPVTIVVPYPPGGTSDVLARLMQEPMQRMLGQPVIIDNKPGASATLGTRLVARAPADGYTLLLPNNGLVISPYLLKEAEYDAVKDFSAVSLISVQPMVLVVHPSLPVDDVRGLVEYVKARPDKVEYASAGAASFGHLATELFCLRAGIRMYHVPYKGQAPTTQAVLTGEVKVLLTTASSQMNGLVKEGRLKLLGVSSAQPSALAPGAEPIGRTVPGFSAEVFFGLVAPAGTPANAIARLNEVVAKTLAVPELRARFESAGADPRSSSPSQFGERIAEESSRWGDVIRESGIKIG